MVAWFILAWRDRISYWWNEVEQSAADLLAEAAISGMLSNQDDTYKATYFYDESMENWSRISELLWVIDMLEIVPACVVATIPAGDVMSDRAQARVVIWAYRRLNFINTMRQHWRVQRLSLLTQALLSLMLTCFHISDILAASNYKLLPEWHAFIASLPPGDVFKYSEGK